MKNLDQKVTFLLDKQLRKSIENEAGHYQMSTGEFIRSVLSQLFDPVKQKQRRKKALRDLFKMEIPVPQTWEELRDEIAEARVAGLPQDI